VSENAISFYSASKPYNPNDPKISIADGTIVDLTAFEFSGTYTPETATVTNGSIVFTPPIPSGTKITQLMPIDGMLSVDPVVK
jgi:hypothetical protein